MRLIVFAAVVAVLMLFSVLLANRLSRRLGMDSSRHRAAKRRVAYALVPLWALVVFEAWAFDNRHRAIAVIVLAGVAIVPEFVLIPLRIKRSRRRRGQRSA